MSIASGLSRIANVEGRMRDALHRSGRDAPPPVQRAVRAQTPPSARPVLRVAAVQRVVELTNDVSLYVRRLESFVAAASAQNCHLVAFPEYNMLDLAGAIPFVRGASRRMERRAQRETQRPKRKAAPANPDALASLAEPLTRAMFACCQELAARHHIAVYTGSGWMRGEDGAVHNVGRLYDAYGRLVLEQAKLHMTPAEDALGVTPGRALTVATLRYPTATGGAGVANVCCPICMDATYFETFSVARRLGADVAILPIANDEPYNLYASLRGLWPRVQSAQMVGVRPALGGHALGMSFTGCAMVCAPLRMARNGLLSHTGVPLGKAMAIADIDFDALRRARRDEEILGDENPAFEQMLRVRYETMHA